MDLSREQLAALPYTGSAPFAGGLTAEDYRIQYQQHGKAFRWWKAYEAADGQTGPNGEPRNRDERILVEQELNGAKCLLYSTKFDMMDEQFGLLPAGSTSISVLPDECELQRKDRLQFPDVLRMQREITTRTGANAVLLYAPSQILKVLSGSAVVPPSAYEMTAGGLLWKSGAPAIGASFTIEYRYVGTWEYLFDEQGTVQRGVDALPLPQRGVIRLMRAGEME